MQKIDAISQVAFSFVPEGSRLVAVDFGSASFADLRDEGGAMIAAARIVQDSMTTELADLPDEIGKESETRIRDAVNTFFNGMRMALWGNGPLMEMPEEQRDACLAKIGQLLALNGI